MGILGSSFSLYSVQANSYNIILTMYMPIRLLNILLDVGEVKKLLSQTFSIFTKMSIIRPLTPIFGLGQTSIASPILFC